MRFSSTCWSWTRSPNTSGRADPNCALDRHATLDQVAVDQLEHFRHDFVEVEIAGRLDIAFPEQRTETVDNVPRPPVVVNDVLEDLAQLVHVQRAVAEQMLRGPGVGKDRGERLVQLVREGAGSSPSIATRPRCATWCRCSCASASARFRAVTSRTNVMKQGSPAISTVSADSVA